MAIFAAVLVALLEKAVAFLPIAFIVWVVADRYLDFHATFLRMYTALLAGNIAATTIVAFLPITGSLAPPTDDPPQVLTQIALGYMLMFLAQATFLLGVLQDHDGHPISPPVGILIAALLAGGSLAVTLFIRSTAF